MERITFNDFGDTEPDWKPHGSTIAYACQKNGNYDICLLEIAEIITYVNNTWGDPGGLYNVKQTEKALNECQTRQ